MKKRKKSTPTNMRINCDRRVRAFIHVRENETCQRCGDTAGPHEHAHILRRGKAWVRTDERNGWLLCKPCHDLVDNNDKEFGLLVERTIGWELYDELNEKSLRGSKENGNQRFDWAAELERWKAMS